MKKIIGFMLVLLSSINVWAADGSSGCGPGWYVLKDTSLVSSALRAVTNGVLLPVVTLGMTLGTSNCTKHKIVKNEMRSLHYVTMNHHELKADIAKGQGAYLNSFIMAIGCDAGKQEAFGKAFQKGFEQIYQDNSVKPETTLFEAYKIIFSEETLYQQCALG